MTITKDNVNEALQQANEGNVVVQYDLATYYKSECDYYNALVWYIKAAEQGNEKALELLFAPIEIEDKPKIVEIKPLYAQKAEEDAKRKAEEEKKRQEEEAKRQAEQEEAMRKAEEEKRRQAEEAKRKAEAEEAKRKAEEEHKQLINHIKENSQNKIQSFLDDMVYVKGKDVLMRDAEGKTYIKKVDDFLIKKNVVSLDDFKALYLNKCDKETDIQNFINLMSEVAGYSFSLPSDDQLIYALRGGINCTDAYEYSKGIINLSSHRHSTWFGGFYVYELTETSFVTITHHALNNLNGFKGIDIQRKRDRSWDSRDEVGFRVVCNDAALIDTYKKAVKLRISKEKEETRRKAEQEAQLLAQEKSRLAPLLEGLNNEMLLVESGNVPVERIIIQGDSPHTVKTEEFCILYSTVNEKAVEFILGRELKTDEFGAFSKEIAEELCEKLTKVSGKEFSLPSVDQLEAAYNFHLWSIRASLCCYEWCKDKNDVKRTLISTKLNRPAPAVACFRFVTKDPEVIASVKEKNSWQNIIKEYISQRETHEYKHGIIFGDKRNVTIVKQPLTYRVWKAVMQHDTLRDQNSDNLVAKKDLDDFLKRLNESDIDLSQFDYIHNNPYAYGALSSRKVIDDKGIYLYIKD